MMIVAGRKLFERKQLRTGSRTKTGGEESVSSVYSSSNVRDA